MSKTYLSREEIVEQLDELYAHLNQHAVSGNNGARRAMAKVQQAVGDLDVKRAAAMRTQSGFGTGLLGETNLVSIPERRQGRFAWKEEVVAEEESTEKKSLEGGSETASPAADQFQHDNDTAIAARDAVQGLSEEEIVSEYKREELFELAESLGVKVGANASKSVIAKAIVNATTQDQDQ